MADTDRQLTGILGVLAEGVRFRILSLIASKGELTAKDILSEFEFTQPTLSHHMACLTEAGLVNVERKGRFAYYSINKKTIELVSSAIDSLKESPKKAVKAKEVTIVTSFCYITLPSNSECLMTGINNHFSLDR